MAGGLPEGRGAGWWDEFFADRAKPCPFFVEWPDENLIAWFSEGLLAPGRVLELGSGPGRNAGSSARCAGCQEPTMTWLRVRAAPSGPGLCSARPGCCRAIPADSWLPGVPVKRTFLSRCLPLSAETDCLSSLPEY